MISSRPGTPGRSVLHGPRVGCWQTDPPDQLPHGGGFVGFCISNEIIKSRVGIGVAPVRGRPSLWSRRASPTETGGWVDAGIDWYRWRSRPSVAGLQECRYLSHATGTSIGAGSMRCFRRCPAAEHQDVLWKNGPPSLDGSHLDWADEGAWGAGARPARVSLIDRSDHGFVEEKFNRRIAGKWPRKPCCCYPLSPGFSAYRRVSLSLPQFTLLLLVDGSAIKQT